MKTHKIRLIGRSPYVELQGGRCPALGLLERYRDPLIAALRAVADGQETVFVDEAGISLPVHPHPSDGREKDVRGRNCGGSRWESGLARARRRCRS